MKSYRVRKNTFNRCDAPKPSSFGVDFKALDKHLNLELKTIFEK
jgi:hypothetical protein